MVTLMATSGCQNAEISTPPSLRYVATAEQVGPVAYRDPLGAVSPDGQWLAYTRDRFVEVIPASGGAVSRMGAGQHDLRQLAWMGNSSDLAVLERTFDRGTQTWYYYDRQTGQHKQLWPDGRWIQYPSYRRLPDGSRRSDLFLIGIDQDMGLVTSPARPVPLTGFAFDAQQGEWLGGSSEILFEAADGPNSKLLYRVSRQGGVARLVHRFSSPQVFSGISASPDGKWGAFVAPGPDGYLQIHRVNMAGGVPQLITSDPTHKTQPAYSPDGSRLAFTVVSYKVLFWEAKVAADL